MDPDAVDASGSVLVQVDERVAVGGGEVDSLSAADITPTPPLPCEGPYWAVGDTLEAVPYRRRSQTAQASRTCGRNQAATAEATVIAPAVAITPPTGKTSAATPATAMAPIIALKTSVERNATTRPM